jgi:hypothetical protein
VLATKLWQAGTRVFAGITIIIPVLSCSVNCVVSGSVHILLCHACMYAGAGNVCSRKLRIPMFAAYPAVLFFLLYWYISTAPVSTFRLPQVSRVLSKLDLMLNRVL